MPEIDREKAISFHDMALAAGKITVALHQHPDGDAAGCALAMVGYLRSLGKEAAALFPDRLDNTVSFVTALAPKESFAFFPDSPAAAEKRVAESDLLLVMDCNSCGRTGNLAPFLESAKAPKVLVDHHLGPVEEEFVLTFSTPEVSSASEMTYWLLLMMPEIQGDPGKLPGKSAELLMTGMTTDTNNFANSTFPSTLEMASGLLSAGVDRDALLERLYHSCRESRLRAMGCMLEKMEVFPEGAALMIMTMEERERFGIQDGDTEGFVNIPLEMGSVRLSVWLKEDEGYFRVSVRSKKGTSAARMAALYFCGGGHEQASGGRLWIGEQDDPARKWVKSAKDALEYAEKAIREFLG